MHADNSVFFWILIGNMAVDTKMETQHNIKAEFVDRNSPTPQYTHPHIQTRPQHKNKKYKLNDHTFPLLNYDLAYVFLAVHGIEPRLYRPQRYVLPLHHTTRLMIAPKLAASIGFLGPWAPREEGRSRAV